MNKILKIFMKKDCRTCKLVKMKLDTVEKEPYMQVDLQYIDVDADDTEAKAFKVTSVPTMILLNGDAVMWRHVGNLIYHELRNNIEA